MFDQFGVAVPASRAELARIRRLVAKGTAVRLHPRVYVLTDSTHEPLTRVRAAQAWCPDGVLVGAAAARIGYWPDAPLATPAIASPRRSASPPGLRVERRQLPPEWVMERPPFRCTTPAFTAAVMAGHAGGSVFVDEALRRGVPLRDILAAPVEPWPGTRLRRLVLAESRDEPWSPLERHAHRLLRGARITGWGTNVRVAVAGRHVHLDIAFRRPRVALELDGYAEHGTRAAFERDRARQNLLVLAGWRVLRFTWADLEFEPDRFVHQVRQALRDSQC